MVLFLMDAKIRVKIKLEKIISLFDLNTEISDKKKIGNSSHDELIRCGKAN